MSELISVIIPVYNTELFLERCVESICAQTYENLEIILVEDGSTDTSGNLCDQYAAKDCRVQVIHQKNGGVSSARNAGLKIAKGEYITFFDSDDYAEKNMLQKLLELKKSSKAEIASCAFRKEKEKTEGGMTMLFGNEEAISDMLCCKNITYAVCGKLFQRSVVKELKFKTDCSHNEDLLFCYQAILRSNRIVHIPEALYVYVNNKNSATRISFNHKRLTAITVQEIILSDIQKRFPVSGLSRTAEQQFLKVNIYTAMQMACAGYNEKNDKKRVRLNVKRRLWKLLTGNLAVGYKLNGLLLSINQYLFDAKIRGEIGNK